MKKIIISGLVLATFLTPSVGYAQVVQEDLQVQLETLKQQLIELLMAQIATLQAQIEQLIAEQADLRVAQVETPVVLGVVEPVIGQTICNPDDSARGTIRIPLNIGGGWGSARAEITFPNGDVMKQGWSRKPTIFQTRNISGTSTVRIYTSTDESAIQNGDGDLVVEQDVFIGDPCEEL